MSNKECPISKEGAVLEVFAAQKALSRRAWCCHQVHSGARTLSWNPACGVLGDNTKHGEKE